MPRSTIAALALAMAGAAGPAQACLMSVPMNPDDIRYADVVVVGRIADYRIVLDQQVRRDRRRMLAYSPRMPAEMRRQYASQTRFLSDYARFDILVDRVLVGRAGRRLTVTWDNSTFGEPSSLPAGPFLIALRRSGSRTPPLRGPSATILPNPEPRALTVLQAPCAGAFIVESRSGQANAIRRRLAREAARPNPR